MKNAVRNLKNKKLTYLFVTYETITVHVESVDKKLVVDVVKLCVMLVVFHKVFEVSD